MEEKLIQMNAWFADRIAACERRRQALQDDSRADEAVFEKIKINVCDIFRTVLSAAVTAGQGKEAAVRDFFLKKTEQLPAAWPTAYEKAAQHDDAKNMQIEHVKLDTLAEIQNAFQEIWGCAV